MHGNAVYGPHKLIANDSGFRKDVIAGAMHERVFLRTVVVVL